uniref:Uncharacterized protein n=1 Tax=Hippocampus comes TaxID=109280 RepID=A0A3Q2YUF2_HIPCM
MRLTKNLMTFGSDGVIRGWDFETIDNADGSGESGKFEMEPVNETTVWRHARLSSIVKSSQSDSTVWFAQDSNGAIWKVDLSFTYTTPDPQCLLSSHAGPIEALDVSKSSHLMATTALDRSVRVYDLLTKRELVSSRFNQGGTALHWAPLSVKYSGGLLVTGFEDGVVRLLELYDAKGLHNNKGGAHIRLKQAFKPHNGPVTSVAYDCNGKILATGSSDCTVFFFTVGEKYEPIGFVHVPGPVQLLEWSPHSHQENRLLILCQNAHVVEVPCPDQNTLKPTKSFQLLDLPRRFFCFKSIKSQIKVSLPVSWRAEEMARLRALKVKQVQEEHQGVGEEVLEEELPPIFIPNPRSPLLCGFYSRPGQFWLSMVHIHIDTLNDDDLIRPPSIETVQQKLEKDHRCREAEKKKSDKRRRLAEIQNIFKKLLKDNLELPEHFRLTLTVLTHTHTHTHTLSEILTMKRTNMNSSRERVQVNWFFTSL